MSELTLTLRPQDDVECRACGVHCDKVVYPSACIERSCPFVYAYEEHGHTFMGCMQRVYEVEIDLAMVRAAEARRAGFGAVKAMRNPLPMCQAEIEPCYEQRTGAALGFQQTLLGVVVAAAPPAFAAVAASSWRLAFALAAIGPLLGVLALSRVAEPRSAARRLGTSAIPPAAR